MLNPWNREMDVIKICVVLTTALQCDGVSFWGQLEHVARQNAENKDGGGQIKSEITRRFHAPNTEGVILGAPLWASHLPEAEPILPGHTLIRPAMGMLKSSVKFPHRDNEDGAGVYGNIDHLSIRYDGKNERVLYSGFRRSLPPDDKQNYVLVLPSTSQKNELRRGWRSQMDKRKPTRSQQVPNSKKRKKMLDNRSNNFKKIIAIYPAKLVMKKHIKQKEKLRPNKLKAFQHSEDATFTKASKSKLTALRDILRLIKSLRRDQEFNEGQEGPEDYIDDGGFISPARVGVVAVVAHPVVAVEVGPSNKTRDFWETQDAFNHIKINPDAPEHGELLPLDEIANEKEREWWFYQQSDFEEFEDR